MDHFEKRLRQHYESQRLPISRVQAILTTGRAGTADRKHRFWWRWAAAASLFVCLGMASYLFVVARSNRPRIDMSEVAAMVTAFFAQSDHQLGRVSGDRSSLVEWLHTHGGPGDIAVPLALTKLQSYGCQVLDVRGRQIYLLCFLLPPSATAAAPGAMPMKNAFAAASGDAPGDAMMKKKAAPLVHLLVAPQSAFRQPPRVGEFVGLPPRGEWNFTTWSRHGLVYIAAGEMPAEQLTGLVGGLKTPMTDKSSERDGTSSMPGGRRMIMYSDIETKDRANGLEMISVVGTFRR